MFEMLMLSTKISAGGEQITLSASETKALTQFLTPKSSVRRGLSYSLENQTTQEHSILSRAIVATIRARKERPRKSSSLTRFVLFHLEQREKGTRSSMLRFTFVTSF